MVNYRLGLVKGDKGDSVEAVDTVIDGNLNPVTSNAVYDVINIVNTNLNNKENSSNKVSEWSGSPSDTRYPSEKLVKDTFDNFNSAIDRKIEELKDLIGGVTINISASRPYLLSGEVTDLVVTLHDGEGTPLANRSVTISDGTSVYNGITNNDGLFTLFDVEVSSGYKTFTATYGAVSDSVDVFLCTSVDYATSNKNTNMWVLSNFTLSRGDFYSTLTEGSSTGTCISDGSHKIAPTQTISFDLCQMDGTKYQAPIYVRNDGGGISLASIQYSELNANVGEWVHVKIVFNNTSTITIYADTLAEPITKTLSATSTNYRLMLYGNNAITTLYFKNVAIY